jgi:hypothetical protein
MELEVHPRGARADLRARVRPLSLHHSEPPANAMAKHRIVSLGKPPARSPCLNVIENLFGTVERRLEELWIEAPAKTVEETVDRFHSICTEEEASGAVLDLARSMPRRLKKCIAAKGGPIKY